MTMGGSSDISNFDYNSSKSKGNNNNLYSSSNTNNEVLQGFNDLNNQGPQNGPQEANFSELSFEETKQAAMKVALAKDLAENPQNG